MSKTDILTRALLGESIKFKAGIAWKSTLKKIVLPKERIPVIVSLTSYGKRVEKIVPYTILSLLNQSVRPKKIVLWLDERVWNRQNIPSKLKDLEGYGLEVAFCRDVRSFTKLVPTIKKYPDDIIITVDDDLYYSDSFLEELYKEHIKKPDHIITLNFCYPTFENGEISPYKKWSEYHFVKDDRGFSEMLIFPQGFGGVLYPPNSLHADAVDETLFLKMSPFADDIWFYIMGILRGTKKSCILATKTKYYFLDLFRQIWLKDRLHDKNVGEDKNDIQLKNTVKYYNLELDKMYE